MKVEYFLYTPNENPPLAHTINSTLVTETGADRVRASSVAVYMNIIFLTICIVREGMKFFGIGTLLYVYSRFEPEVRSTK